VTSVEIIYIPINWTSTISNTTPSVTSSAIAEYRLTILGKLLATMLAHTLDQLKNYNEEAIYPILSLLEPYSRDTDQELYVRMPPKSSREVIIEVTRQGRAKPKADLD